MRVAIDARLVHYQQAGIGVYVSRLIQELDAIANSREFTVLLSRKDKSSAATRSRFRKVRLWTPCHNRYEQLTLPIELLGRGIDLLHSPDFIPPLARRCRSVITIHDLAFLLYPDILTDESRRYYSQVRRAARSADAIIAVSNSTKRDIVDRLGVPESRVFVVHQGADAFFRPIEDDAGIQVSLRKLGIKGPFILFVGTLEPRKNLPTLLAAFAQVVSSRPYEYDAERKRDKVASEVESHDGGGEPGLRLVIAGRKGWLYDEIYSRVRALGLSERVIFTGPLEPEDLVALYNAAILLVQPSLYEGFGIPPLEAMACGTPCIVSNTSSLPEVVGAAAIKVDPLNQRDWTEAILRLLSSPDQRRELTHRGLERARQFTWSLTAQRTLEVYRQVLEGFTRP